MSNLSELLPAGGAAKEFEVVASGSLGNGATVVLKSDGTVEVVASVSTTYTESIPAGSSVTFNSAINTVPYASSFDPNNANKFIVAYRISNASGWVVVGTVSGTSISFSTAYTLGSGINSIDVSFDKNTANRFVVSYAKDSNGYGTSVIGTISGTSISFGSEATFNTSSTADVRVEFEPSGTNKFVVAYKDSGNSDYATSCVGTVSGTSISFGTEVVFNSVLTQEMALAFDPHSSNKFIVAYRDKGGSNYGEAQVGTISGTTASFGTAVAFSTGGIESLTIDFDPHTVNRFAVVCDSDAGAFDWNGHIFIGTLSGTSMSFSSGVMYTTTDRTYYADVKWDPNIANKLAIGYRNSSSGWYGTIRVCTVSGTTVSLGSETVMVSSSTYNTSITFDAYNAGKFVFTWADASDTKYGKSRVCQMGGTVTTNNLTATNFAGTSTAAFTNGQTATIVPQGGVASSIANVVSLLASGSEAVFESGNTEWTSVAMLTSTKAIVTYSDITNSGYGTACILDVSGSSITAGTPAVFESAATYYTSVTMLTSTKAIVTYNDGGNGGYGTSVILDVSGSSITAGTPVVFESANIGLQSVAALSSTKAIVAYSDVANASYGTSCILDVSGSTITVGTAVVFESANANYISVAMLTSTKAIATYQDNGNGNYGTSCILDVSGSSITAGTPVVFESASTAFISVNMLTSTKAIVAYQDKGNSDYGTSCILDVSGSAITAGTPAVFNSAISNYTVVAMLSSTKAVVTCQDGGNSYYGAATVLEISGSTITAGASVLYTVSSTFSSITSLEPTKAIVTYRQYYNSQYGTSCILDITALTAGTTYYVQSDGSVSTVSASPAVQLGKAISTTSLILKGNS